MLEYSHLYTYLNPCKIRSSKDIKIVYFRGSDDYAPPPKKISFQNMLDWLRLINSS